MNQPTLTLEAVLQTVEMVANKSSVRPDKKYLIGIEGLLEVRRMIKQMGLKAERIKGKRIVQIKDGGRLLAELYVARAGQLPRGVIPTGRNCRIQSITRRSSQIRTGKIPTGLNTWQR